MSTYEFNQPPNIIGLVELRLWELGQLQLTPDEVAQALRLPVILAQQAVAQTIELLPVAV